MSVRNADIAFLFDEIADLLDILGENPFRSRAYRNAAMTVRDYGPDLGALVGSGAELPKLPGIGPDLAQKIHEIAMTGETAMHQRLCKQVPAGLLEMLQLPGLGPKRVRAIWKELGVQSLDDLVKACEAGRLRRLRGIGEKLETQLREAITERAGARNRRFLLGEASSYATDIAEALRAVPGVAHVSPAGSYRRGLETVGDLDLIATGADPAALIEQFIQYQANVEILARGTTKASIRLTNGLQVDLRVVPADSYGAAMHYFTGSKGHNIAIRQIGQRLGLKINEYGVFRGAERIAGDTEASVFAAVGLPFIPPELREDRGEIEAARAGTLPVLVRREDLQGDLHCHTKASDGRDTLEDMAHAAIRRGLTYLAVTEHSRSLSIARGLDEQRLGERLAEIDRLNKRLRGFKLLKGAEVDILEDGSLDYPDELLERLDIVVASVHSRFGESRAQQTRRILRAVEHPRVTILGHPTGRRMPRPPYDVDIERIIRAAKTSGCVLEVNSQPERLDLNDVYCRLAKENGVMVSIDSDAHSTRSLDNIRFGVAQARRGGLEARDVLNTRPLAALRRIISARRADAPRRSA